MTNNLSSDKPIKRQITLKRRRKPIRCCSRAFVNNHHIILFMVFSVTSVIMSPTLYLRHMLGYIDDSYLHHKCQTHETWRSSVFPTLKMIFNVTNSNYLAQY